MIPLLLILSLALIPVYSFASGGMQYSHMALALLMLIRLIQQRWVLRVEEVTLVSLLVLILLREAYALFVEGVELNSLLEILYIVFAALLLLTTSRLPLDRPMFQRSLIFGLGLAGAVALWGIWYYGAAWTVDDGELNRSVGTFNNPNQLAYFAVCLLSIASLLYLRDQFKTAVYLCFVTASLLLSISAISKAGLVAAGMASLVAVAAALNHKRISGKLIVLCFLIAGIVMVLYSMGAFDDFYFVRRLEGIGADSDDTAAGRGYFLPGEGNPLELLFGIGQAGVIEILGHEIHSTFWSFMVKYGLFGFALILLFFYQWAKRVHAEFGVLGLLLVVAPAFLYGLTHNGSRFAIFWLLIGLSFNSLRVHRPLAAAPSPSPPPMPFAQMAPPGRWQYGTRVE